MRKLSVRPLGVITAVLCAHFAATPVHAESRVHGLVFADLSKQTNRLGEKPKPDFGSILDGRPVTAADLGRLRELRLKPGIETLKPRAGLELSPELRLPGTTLDSSLLRPRPDKVPGPGLNPTLARQVVLPDIEISLINARSGVVAATGRSNVNGVFDVAPLEEGRYRLCWSGGPGWQEGCRKKLISASGAGPVYVDPVYVAPRKKAGFRTVAGRVTMEDGAPCRFFDLPMRVDVTAEVQAVASSADKVRANHEGWYVLPMVETATQQVLASCGGGDAGPIMDAAREMFDRGGQARVIFDENAVQSVLAGASTDAVAVATSGTHRIVDLTLPNRRPLAVDMLLETAFGSVERGPAGDSALAVANVLDNQKMAFFWSITGGDGEAFGRSLKWQLPDRPGRYQIQVVATDGLGGWIRMAKTFDVTEDDRQRFAGSIRLDGKPLDPSVLKTTTVTVNGQQIGVNGEGRFFGKVKRAQNNRYVVNVDAEGAVPLSRVFHRSSTGGLYDMQSATMTKFDPKDGGLFRFGRDDDKEGGRSFVRFKPGSLIIEDTGAPVNGMVTAEFAYLDPNRGQLPGDYDAIGAGGDNQALISFGAVYVGLKDAQGRDVQIAQGAEAELQVAVAANSAANPSLLPSSVPVWTYNTKTGFWEQEPVQAVLSGSSYRTAVRHFSTVNMDLGTIGNAACVRVQLDFIRTPDSRILKVITDNGLGGTQVKTVTLDQRLNAVFRLLPLSTTTFEMQHADGSTYTQFQLRDVNLNAIANNTITLQPGEEMQSQVDLWPDEPFTDCARLVIASGDIPEPAEFFTRKSANTINPDRAEAYYAFMDPNGDRDNLEEWLNHNGFQPTATGNGGFTFAPAANVVDLAYLNHGDLGSGRKMHCRKDNDRTACVVGNYAADSDALFNRDPASGDVAGAAESGSGFATVAMEYSPLEGFESEGAFVKFFTFGEGNNRARIIAAALDEGGNARNHPEVCHVCHGGSFPASFPANAADATAVLNAGGQPVEDIIQHFKVDDPSSFREFDLNAISNLQGSQPQSTVKQLNCDYVLDSAPYQAIHDVIIGWYGDDDPGAGEDCDGFSAGGEAQNSGGDVPQAWKGSAADQAIYEDVVTKTCRTCHIAQKNYDFADPNAPGFNWNAAHSGSPYPCNVQTGMPNAPVTFNNYWINGFSDLMEAEYGVCPP